MSDWEPATPEEVESLLEAEIETLHPAHRRRFDSMRVSPRTVPIDEAPGETVVVIAEHDGRILYWSDVEDGWELEVPTASGGILERSANQYDLSQIMWQLFGDPKGGT